MSSALMSSAVMSSAHNFWRLAVLILDFYILITHLDVTFRGFQDTNPVSVSLKAVPLPLR